MAHATSYNNNIYLIGGFINNKTATNNCEIYDTIANKWTSVNLSMKPRQHFNIAVNGSKLFIFGGVWQENLTECLDIEEYDLDKLQDS